ncbi:MAG: GNAT family N-acetyltransferase [Pseudorhodoplanes sp.]|nr:GNAT family N-acetyltransferase [Pseudorhodoplanes sp.]
MALSDPAPGAISALQPHEIAAANALVCEAGWNQVDADWRIFLALGQVYAMRDGGGHVVATAATLSHGQKFAWISMVLVRGAFRRQGLATLLLRRCIDDLTARGCVPILDATPAGREVYRALGFEDVWGYHRLALQAAAQARIAPRPHGVEIRPIDETAWRDICDYDAAAFGARRDALLAGLRGRLPGAEYCAVAGDRIVGFLLGRDGRVASQLGPLIADNDEIAIALLQRALAAIPAPIFIDLADTRSAVLGYLSAAGFAPQRPLTRMQLGSGDRFDDPLRTYAVAGPEFG